MSEQDPGIKRTAFPELTSDGGLEEVERRITNQQIATEAVSHVLALFDPLEQRVISLRRGLSDGIERTQKQTAAEMHMSIKTVRNIEKGIKGKLQG